MYPKYFGLKEPSFSIAPDPHYLFLSEQHKEALAHLLYGAGESGGFVLLTGEVGTGKTTVSRAFLEQLPEGVDVALILNPAQSANELLTNVCEEFRIPLPFGKRSNKMLIDRLNQYLLSAHADGRRPLLIIDEAQNLLPQSMEQIRLLTNLETTKHKLLQIFLIGQPELRRMLERDRLRQLNQRITARYHLAPFSLKETGDYIRHRIAVAGVDRPLFSAAAIRRIYRFSGGIPRLINILCDRALLGVCVTRGSQVTPAIVAKAAREVRGDPIEMPSRSPWRLILVALASFALVVTLGFWAHSRLRVDPREMLARLFQEQALVRQDEAAPSGEQGGVSGPVASGETSARSAVSAQPVEALATTAIETKGPSAQSQPDTPSASAPAVDDRLASEQTVTSTNEPTAAAGLAGALDGPLDRFVMSESDAMRMLLRRWGVDLKSLQGANPCEQIRQYGLACEQEQGRLSHVRFFNLPALLRVLDREGQSRYVVLGALGVEQATLDLASGGERVPVAELERIWTGDYTLIWQLPPDGSTLIGAGSSGGDVRWLRDRLASVPGLSMLPSNSAYFDSTLVSALRAFQASKGLMPDGVAGPRTLIVLLHALGSSQVPRLDVRSAQPASAEAAP